MGGQSRAPISAVLQLKPTVTLSDVSDALSEWLKKSHAAELKTFEREDLVVEWRTSDGEWFACQLVTSHSATQARRTVTVIGDNAGVIAIVEESPLASSDSPHAVVDLSEEIQLLLLALLPIAEGVMGLTRQAMNQIEEVDPNALLAALQDELAPGLLVAVTDQGKTQPSKPQHELLDALRGLAVIGSAPVGASVFSNLGSAGVPRAGSVVSIARTSTGLEAQIVASTSLKTKLASARRLVVRRQLSAPIPFDLERRRSAAMTQLLAGGEEVDLPTALQLLEDESERANELENRLKDVETQLERTLQEQDTALGELDDALSRLRYLDRAFRELGEVPTVEAGIDDDWRPDSTVDALMAAREWLHFLVISPTEELCSVLDGQQRRAVWAKKIWLTLRALNDYCRTKAAGQFNGDIAMYRANPPSGAIPLLSEYAPVESESTSNQLHLRSIRTFAVPTSVDSTGKIYMQQHVKIDQGGQSAPRIHLYDDSGGPTQRIYIGYIGPHLATSSAF